MFFYSFCPTARNGQTWMNQPTMMIKCWFLTILIDLWFRWLKWSFLMTKNRNSTFSLIWILDFGPYCLAKQTSNGQKENNKQNKGYVLPTSNNGQKWSLNGPKMVVIMGISWRNMEILICWAHGNCSWTNTKCLASCIYVRLKIGQVKPMAGSIIIVP